MGEGRSLDGCVLECCEYRKTGFMLSFCRELFDDVRIDSDVSVEGRESSKKHGRLYTDMRPVWYQNRQVIAM